MPFKSGGPKGRGREGAGGARSDDKQMFRRRGPGRRKVCRFCAEKDSTIDYKDGRTLSSFLSERGKIIPSRITGNCARHQRLLTSAIKLARTMALLPFTTVNV